MLDIELLAASGRLFDNHYKLIRPLSTDGGTADVWLALDMNTVKDPDNVGDITRMEDGEIEQLGLIVAIKIYRPQNALDIEGEQRFRDEYMIVFNCHHTNLIHPTHFSIFHEVPYLVLPYCKQGSSEKYVGKMTDTDDLWKYIGDVSSGLAYLHALTPPIIHQDIKPGNVLIDDNQNYSITDFGISAKRGSSSSDDYEEEEKSGTISYMAPERFHEGVEPSPPGDMWAFGATLCEMITGNVPFGDDGGWAQAEQNAPMPELPSDLPADIQRLIYACLDPDPEKRPTAEYVSRAAEAHQYPLKRKHPWLVAISIAVCALLVGGVVTFFLKEPAQELLSDGSGSVTVVTVEEEKVPVEVVYNQALALIAIDDADSLKAGLELMDSLGKSDNYIPAIYELAHTYGWYGQNDSLSVNRKKLLGIKINQQGLPLDRDLSVKAVAMFTKILDLNDSTQAQYAQEKANAAYRLACYYVMPNQIYQSNPKEAKTYLLTAKDWAIKAGDTELEEKIDRGLATFE